VNSWTAPNSVGSESVWTSIRDLPAVSSAGRSIVTSTQRGLSVVGTVGQRPASWPSTDTTASCEFGQYVSIRRVSRTPSLAGSTRTVNVLDPSRKPRPSSAISGPTSGPTICGTRTASSEIVPGPFSRASVREPPGASATDARSVRDPAARGFGSRSPASRSRASTSCARSDGSNVRTPRASANRR
jgi:hypothetical protein